MCDQYNTHLIHFSSYGDLWVQYLRVLGARLKNRTPTLGKPAGPLAFAAVALLLASLYFFASSAEFFFAQIAGM